MKKPIRHLDLFSGIGGNSLAADWVWNDIGHTFCEALPYRREVLRKHWPHAKIYEDIKTLDASQLGPIHLVTGGFPCQPFSFAGERKGKEDDRDLWPEMFRVIKECRPSWIIGENVAGFVGMELDRSITDLESIGYAVQAFDIPAVAVDAPHIRHRVWIVAHADKKLGCTVSVQPKKRRGQGKSTHPPGRCAHVPDSHKIGRNERNIQDGSPSAQEREGSATGRYCRWSAEPGVRRVAYGIPSRVDRVESLGDSIVPQVAAEIMRMIRSIDPSMV